MANQFCAEPWRGALSSRHQTVRPSRYVAAFTKGHKNMARKLHASHVCEIESPTCLKCGAGMYPILIEEEYPGYERRTFGCQSCDGTMTEWAPAPIQASASNQA